jgi:hypothetical protein
VYSRKAGWSYAPPAVLLAVLFSSCSRQPAAGLPPERIAILRLENLSADAALSWQGRALSDVISTALATHAALGPLPADQLAQVTYGAAAQPNAVVTLQPNCPLRPAAMVADAIRRFEDGQADSVVSVTLGRHKLGTIQGGHFVPRYQTGMRSQDMTPEYYENGVIYVSSARMVVEREDLFGARMVPMVIDELYAASTAGAKIELLVRGVCSLRPGVPELSENIRVRSVIGRFLEHSRLFAFDANGRSTCFMGSADLMPRNLDHRVECLVPVAEPALQERVEEILRVDLSDDELAWELGPDGWSKVPVEAGINAQERLQEIALARAERGT